MSNHAAPRILISRMNAIGDAILTLPVACELRDQFPEAYLAWVVEKTAAPMVRNHQALDAVIELERGWSTSIRGVRKACRVLQSHRFNISIDCQGSTPSALAGWLSSASQRIGYAGPCGRNFSRFLNNDLVKPVFNHVTDRSLELLIPVGIHSPRVRWQLPIPATARSWAAAWRHKIPSSSLAILNPGGTWDSKLWENDRFAGVARHLRDAYHYRSMVAWGTHKEREMANAIVDASGGSATLAPETDLHHLAALLEASDLFISGDTGPLHMAVAVGTPTIGLYGATRPGNNGPYRQLALQKAYESGSSRHRRRASNRAMQAITVEHVCDAIKQLESERRLLKSA